MNSRERVIAVIEHREPDRVPVDLGGTIMSGIMAQALDKVRPFLGLESRPPRVYEVFQMLGEVEPDMVERVGIDVLPVEPETLFFGLKRRNYKAWTLFDGTPVRVPGQFNVVDTGDHLIIHDEGDPAKPAVGRMPKNGYYFDQIGDQELHPGYVPPSLEEMKAAYLRPIKTQKLEFMASEAERLRPTGKALLLGDWFDFGPASVGNMPDWLCLLAAEPEYVEELFALKAEGDLLRLAQVKAYLGDNIDLFGVDGADYGTQRAEMFSAEMFEQFYLPYYRAVIGWIRANTPWKTWKHTCGAARKFIPYFIDAGLDCLNPVQCSADGMDPIGLKHDFGKYITFWGGGVDTQRTLPFGTPEEVYQEVAARIRIFAPGGGFVFNTIHNIQANTPPENLDALFRALRDYGEYPIKALE
ncbi:MAG: uroporphyrinogen decarboxylase family protein [Armatimonadota bacterium]